LRKNSPATDWRSSLPALGARPHCSSSTLSLWRECMVCTHCTTVRTSAESRQRATPVSRWRVLSQPPSLALSHSPWYREERERSVECFFLDGCEQTNADYVVVSLFGESAWSALTVLLYEDERREQAESYASQSLASSFSTAVARSISLSLVQRGEREIS